MENSNLPAIAIFDRCYEPRIDLNLIECQSVIEQAEDWIVEENYTHNIENQKIVAEEKYMMLLNRLRRIPYAEEVLREINLGHNIIIQANTAKVHELIESKYGEKEESIFFDIEEFENETFQDGEDGVAGLDYQSTKSVLHIMKLIASAGHEISLSDYFPMYYLVDDGYSFTLGSSQNALLKEFLESDVSSIFDKEDVKDIMNMGPNFKLESRR